MNDPSWDADAALSESRWKTLHYAGWLCLILASQAFDGLWADVVLCIGGLVLFVAVPISGFRSDRRRVLDGWLDDPKQLRRLGTRGAATAATVLVLAIVFLFVSTVALAVPVLLGGIVETATAAWFFARARDASPPHRAS